jgi:hypothetical protein
VILLLRDLPDLILLAAVLAGSGAGLLALGALGLLRAAILRLVARHSPHAAQVQRLQDSLEKYRVAPRTTISRRRRP